jgi:thiol-disulfide isomerase/thioredoxin
MHRFASKYSKIQTESQYLVTMLRTYEDSKNSGVVYDYIKKIDTLIKKDKAKLKVKDFPKKHQWFNSEPLSLNKELKNKIVVIDFWTYCCINCLHVLPELEYLENKYAKDPSVVFMGCHSAKFSNERESNKVREAVMKYDVKHPVINDEEMIFWDTLERNSWPSIAIIGPDGCPLVFMSGEGNKNRIDKFLKAAIEYYDDRLDRKPIALYLEEEKQHELNDDKKLHQESLSKEERAALNSNLRFPSKIICIANQPNLPYDCNLMVVSDTGNNRVLLINMDTHECLDVIGNSNIGLVDGKYDETSFHHPQGLCHVYRENEHFVYVCDSNNHAIREINLNTKD